jgi:hypothetical protein
MGIAVRNDRLRCAVRIAAALGAGVVVAGCGGGSSLPSISGSLPNWFSGTDTPAAQARAAATPSISLEDDCTSIDIRTGTGTLVNANKAQEPTANDVRYQLTFVELARQCFVESGNLRMRVGVQGRAVVGPAGAPPQINAPIRYAVVQEGVQPKTIVTKFRRVPVSLNTTSSTTFTDIEDDLSFPMPSVAVLQSYVVYVGFDEVGEPQSKGKPKPKQAKKKEPKKLERSVAPEFRR